MARDRAVGRVLVVITVLLICSAVILSSGCRGIVGKSPTTPTPNNPQPPSGNPPSDQAPTVAFSATPASVSAGDTVTLSWSSTNATSISISPDPGVGTLALTGQAAVKPTQTTTYTITAHGSGSQTASQSVTVNVAQAVSPTVTITAAPTSIIAGQITTLQWSSANATSITITPSVLGEDQQTTPLQGSKAVTLNQTTTYTATVTGPGGTATASVTITVTQMQINLTAKPDTIATGSPATLSWSTVGVNTMTIDNGVGDVTAKLPTGTASVTPNATTTYTATATGPGGTVTQKVVVSVVAAPPPGTSPIKHIIFLVQENRSFDSYFGRLGPYRAAKVPGSSPTDVDGFDPNVALQSLSGTRTVKPYHYSTVCTEGLTPAWDESHYDAHIQPNDTAYMDANPGSDKFLMDRFPQTTDSVPHQFDPEGTRAMGYYDERDLPFYYELATQFATSDRFFSSLPANTNPNRQYLFTGTSFGHAFPDPAPAGGWKQKTIFRAMNDAGVSWAYYYQDNSVYLSDFADWNDGSISGKVKNISEMFQTLASPTADQDLPQVIFIERAGASGLDEHPDNNVQKGAAVVENIIRKLMASAAWKSSAFILTYDEAGGLYDHVAPFQVPTPDDIAPILSPKNFQGRFNLSGFRVPVVVVSPWVKPHFVSHKNRELTSILRFIETNFKVQSLTRRDAAADDMTEFFDFTKPSLLTPPTLPAQPTGGTCDKTQEAGPTF